MNTNRISGALAEIARQERETQARLDYERRVEAECRRAADMAEAQAAGRLCRFEDAPRWAQAVLSVLAWIGSLPYLAEKWGRDKARDARFILRNEHRARYYSPWVVFWFRLYWRLWYRLGGV